MSDGPCQEMSLEQWVERLSPVHRARREYYRLANVARAARTWSQRYRACTCVQGPGECSTCAERAEELYNALSKVDTDGKP